MARPTEPVEDTPIITKPDDFHSFWQSTLNELNRTPANIQVTQKEKRADGLTLSWLTFQSLEGTTIHAYLLHWQDEAPRPLVVYTHGYGGQVGTMWEWAEKGMNVLGYDTRGFGRSKSSLSNLNQDGWILTGIESPETCIIRGAYCDYIRAHQVGIEMLTGKINRHIFYGFSFGGAMALVGEALSNKADLLAIGVPTFGWMEGRRKYVRLGSGREIQKFLRSNPELDSQVMETLNYFDTVHFAEKVHCPTLIGYGLKDVVVPQQTVKPIINKLTVTYDVRELPVSHTNDPREALWEGFEKEWLALAQGKKPPAN